jgi:hypothetical protein
MENRKITSPWWRLFKAIIIVWILAVIIAWIYWRATHG